MTRPERPIRPRDIRDAQDWGRLGHAAMEQGRFALAAHLLAKAVLIAPDADDLLEARAHALDEAGRPGPALALAARALTLAPESLNRRTLLAYLHLRLHQWPGALHWARQALALDPDHPPAIQNLGVALLRLGHDGPARTALDRAAELAPDDPDLLVDLSAARAVGDDDAGATELLNRALNLAPDHAGAHLHRALLRLRDGDWSGGWAEYEWRLMRPDFAPLSDRPRWRGEDLTGQTLLVWAEQGLGDTLQFARYVPLVAARGARVVLAVEPVLMPVLAGLDGVADLVARGSTIDHDVHCPLQSLALMFDTRPDGVPGPMPYLTAPPPRPLAPRPLADDGRPRIGLVWAGNPRHGIDRCRSLSLADLAPLASIDATFYSLQRGAAAHQAPPPGLAPIDLDADIHDFGDLAAALAGLDLLISVDSAPLHLAGALGRPAWGLIARPPDWRWLRAGDTTAWYPSVTLFRQPAPGDWATPIAAMAERLRTRPIR